MNAQLAAKLLTGIRQVQGLWSESLTVNNGTPIQALMGRESLQQKFTAQGMEEVVSLNVSVAKPDLTGPPAIGTSACARGRKWNIWSVNPTQTTWELGLESPNK